MGMPCLKIKSQCFITGNKLTQNQYGISFLSPLKQQFTIGRSCYATLQTSTNQTAKSS
jgi:hypothetical protein